MLTNRDSSVSATCYGCAEDIGVGAVVIAKLKLRNIERHVFAADLLERADHAALKDRPEALDWLSVDRSDNILSLGVVSACYTPLE
jgi:hypothetical protein